MKENTSYTSGYIFDSHSVASNKPQGPIVRFFWYVISFMKRNPYTSRLIEYLLSNSLYKGALILGTGTAVAQLISIISLPIITRIYSPSDLGILAVYSSILAIVSIGATLKYESAYALPKQDEEAVNLFGLCLILLFIITAGFAFIIFSERGLLMNIFDIGSIEHYRWFLIAGFFGMGLYNMLNYWAIRQRDYKRITHTKINQAISGTACKILLGIVSFGAVGLIIGHIVSQIAGIGTFSRAMWSKDKENLRTISFRGMKDIAKKYRSFPAYNLPASIVNTASLQLPPLMLLALYDSQIVGFYALANALIVLPGTLISRSVGQAYLGEASKMVREGSRELLSLYVKTLRHLAVIGVPLIGIPALCAPFVFPVIFGNEWAEAGWYCLPLTLFVVPQFIASPIGYLSLYGYNNWSFIWNVSRFIGVVISFYLSYLLKLSIIMTLTMYGLVMAWMYVIGIILSLKAIANFTSKMSNE